MLIKLLIGIKTYKLDSVGEDLGNVHVDVDLYGATSESYAIENLFLGKKTYIYMLEATDKDGKTIDPDHIILKGIPTMCIQYYAEQHKIRALGIYKKLYNNEFIKLGLTNDGKQCMGKH